MGKKLYVTDLKKINGLKVACGSCQASFVIPVEEPKVPIGCPFCKKPLDLDRTYIKNILTMVMLMRTIKDNDFSFWIESEPQ